MDTARGEDGAVVSAVAAAFPEALLAHVDGLRCNSHNEELTPEQLEFLGNETDVVKKVELVSATNSDEDKYYIAVTDPAIAEMNRTLEYIIPHKEVPLMSN